jgi:hypothetical protein
MHEYTRASAEFARRTQPCAHAARSTGSVLAYFLYRINAADEKEVRTCRDCDEQA